MSDVNSVHVGASMRDVGIVRTTQGDYAYIAKNGDDRQSWVFVHRKDAPQWPLPRGTVVFFDIVINPVIHEPQAIHVSHLAGLSPDDVLRFMRDANDTLWSQGSEASYNAIRAYIELLPRDQAIAWLATHFNDIPEPRRTELAIVLPREIVAGSRPLRLRLPIDERLRIYTDLLQANHSGGDDPEILAEFALLLRAIPLRRRAAIVCALPVHLLSAIPELRGYLSPDKHLEICLDMLAAATEEPIIPEIKREIVDLIRAAGTQSSQLHDSFQYPQGDDLWSRLPADLQIDPQIWPLLPQPYRIARWVESLSYVDDASKPGIITQIVQAIRRVAPNEHPSLWPLLPDVLKRHAAIFPLLDRSEQVKVLIPLITASTAPEWRATWRKLPRMMKIYCVFYAVSIGVHLAPVEFIGEEPDPLVRAVLLLLWLRDRPDQSTALFGQFHALIEDYITAEAWTSDQLLDLSPLLPQCPPHNYPLFVRYRNNVNQSAYYSKANSRIFHCEGRPWDQLMAIQVQQGETSVTTDNTRPLAPSRAGEAFCPRARRACSLFNPHIPGNAPSRTPNGARLYPEPTLQWQAWSLLELLDAVGVEPSLPRLRRPEEYVSKLSGWVNRLNEIRQRLKCSVCGQMMRPNVAYARLMARFNVTVVSCGHGTGHDYNVYLNECWSCEEIIDSRESRHQLNGYYLCIWCGSGPQQSKTYTQGDQCPRCGVWGMTDGGGRERICHSCGHHLRLPKERHLTGPECPKCAVKRTSLMLNEEGAWMRQCSACHSVWKA